MKRLKRILVLIIVFGMAFSSLTGCGIFKTTMSSEEYLDYKVVDGEYDESLFYINDLELALPDPNVIYIDRGEEEGWFYAYGTSDDIGIRGFQCWRSKDFCNWEYKGVAYMPEFGETWADGIYWAPEVIYDEETNLYLMFYSAQHDVDAKKYLSVACASEPYGPFRALDGVYNADEKLLKVSEPAFDFFPETNPILAETGVLPKGGEATIDAHPFEDPATGKKYLYWSQAIETGQSIFGCEMKDWFTPDYTTVTKLTVPNQTKVEGGKEFEEDTKYDCNEGPFMYVHEGKYYLTYSASGYMDEKYHVRQAIADSPLGDFEKLLNEEGGQVLYADPSFGNVSSAGHHSFFKAGDELYMAYHTFINRRDLTDGRALAIDKVLFVENKEGEQVLRANGPTYSYQPLPTVVSGYENVALDAKIKANRTEKDSDVKYLNDGRFTTHYNDDFTDVYRAKKGKSTIKLEFDEPVLAKAVMVYNAGDYEESFIEVSSVEVEYVSGVGTKKAVMKNIPFDFDWHSADGAVIFPGASSIVEFDDVPVKSITVKVPSVDGYPLALNEIVVLGKQIENPAPQSSIQAFKYENGESISAKPVYESKTFGTAGDYPSRYAFDLSHDDGTEDAYVDSVFAGGEVPLFFKDVVSTDFYMETEVTVLNEEPYCMEPGTPKDPSPRIGLIVRDASKEGDSDTRFLYWNLTCFETYDSNQMICLTSDINGMSIDWKSWEKGQTNVRSLKCTDGNYVKLAIARLGDTFYLIANDEVVMVRDDIEGFNNSEDTASAVGFMTYSTSARFRNYSVVTDASKVKTTLEGMGVTLK